MRNDGFQLDPVPEPLEQEERPTSPAFFPHPLALGGATFLTAGLLDVLAHLGATGLVVGGIAAIVAARHGGDIWEQVQDLIAPFAPESFSSTHENPLGTSGVRRRLIDTLLTRPADAEQQEDIPSEDEDDTLHLGVRLRPHVNTVFSNRLAILGMPGSGKSNAVADFIEELGQFDAPIVVFDHKPEYAPLADPAYLTNPFRAGAHNVTPTTAFAFGQRVMQERLQVVLNLRSYQNDNAAAQVMMNLIKGIWLWEEVRNNDERLPCTFVLDEAHYWLPEAEHLSTVSRVKDAKTGVSLFTQLQQAFFNLVNGGRSLGMGIIVSTQRPANIDKRVIGPAEWKLLLKANLPNDLKVYREYGVSPDMAMALAVGEAYVIGPGGIRGVFQLRRRHSPDDAKTPGVENLRRRGTAASTLPEQSAELPWPPSFAAPSAPDDGSPSQASDDPLQESPSSRRAVFHLLEGANEAGRRGGEGDEGDEGATGRLSELEVRVGSMFFEQGLNPNAILREVYPEIKGGDLYQKAAAEINNAIRRYVAVRLQKGA